MYKSNKMGDSSFESVSLELCADLPSQIAEADVELVFFTRLTTTVDWALVWKWTKKH